MKKRTTISIHPELHAKAKQLMTLKHFDDFSEFLEHLIREESDRRELMTTAPQPLKEEPASFGKQKKKVAG